MARGCFSVKRSTFRVPPTWLPAYGNEIGRPRYHTLSRELSDFQAHSEVGQYATRLYNQRRRHSTLGQMSPAEFERRKNEEDKVLATSSSHPRLRRSAQGRAFLEGAVTCAARRIAQVLLPIGRVTAWPDNSRFRAPRANITRSFIRRRGLIDVEQFQILSLPRGRRPARRISRNSIEMNK